MKCTIPGANLKVLARAIQALSRIGDELYVEPDFNSVSFKSVNSSRSAYGSFTFNKSFFAFYKYEPSALSASQEENSKCKISMKSCLPVFRSPVMLDRKVENCIMRIADDHCQIIFEMKFRSGFTKTYFLPVIESETLEVVYTNNSANFLSAQATLFGETVQNFSNSQDEVTLSVAALKTSLTSYNDGTTDASKIKSTEIVLDPVEFDKYNVSEETSITFSLKEFRAILAFAEATVQNIEACFESKGKPIVFGVKHEKTYEAKFVLSTLSPEVDVRLTPQQLRGHHSKTPTVISTATDPSAKVASSTSRQNTSCHSRSISNAVTNNALLEQLPELRPCTPAHGNNQLPVPSPSLLSTMRNSVHNQTVDGCRQSSTERNGYLLEKIGSSTKGLRDTRVLNNNVPRSQERRFSRECVDSSTNCTNGITTSQERENMMSPPIMMSNMSSGSLQFRESDNDYNDECNDTVSSSQPPQRRPRLCDIFDLNYDPKKIPGYDIILVEDSGDENA